MGVGIHRQNNTCTGIHKTTFQCQVLQSRNQRPLRTKPERTTQILKGPGDLGVEVCFNTGNLGPGTFYLLYKIHRLDNPGCSTGSGIGTIMEEISGYVDPILFPYATGAARYEKDTTDIFKKLNFID